MLNKILDIIACTIRWTVLIGVIVLTCLGIYICATDMICLFSFIGICLIIWALNRA